MDCDIYHGQQGHFVEALSIGRYEIQGDEAVIKKVDGTP